MKWHQEIEHNDQIFRCFLCKKEFKENSSLKIHFKEDHENKRLKCDKCGKKFNHLDSLKRHNMLLHLNEIFPYALSKIKTEKCSKCGKTFMFQSHLKRHFEKHELKENGLKFKCKYCNNTYGIRQSFYRHMKKNHRDKKIEPNVVIEDIQIQNGNSKFPIETSTNLTLSNVTNVKSKLKKGKWVVILERIDLK